MAEGVVLDTSFLITLADANRQNHSAARSYWEYFMEMGIPLFLPTIVVSEFYIRQEIHPGILKRCIVLPFNWDDALKAAELDFSKFKEPKNDRVALKDDVKILAQAMIRDAAYIITDDSKTFYRFALTLVQERAAPFIPIKLEDGFDHSYFNKGQTELKLDSKNSLQTE